MRSSPPTAPPCISRRHSACPSPRCSRTVPKYLRWHPLGVPHVILRAGATVDAIGVDAVERAVNHLLPQAAQRDERLADAAHTQPAAAAAAPVIMTIAS